ncbi:MAG: S8/S53 family peptidase, partial [Pseudomonadota bacterium]
KDGDYEVKDTVWDGLREEPARIALIDTGVSDHPNLVGRLRKDLAIDFGTDLGGAVYRGNDPWQTVLQRWGSTDAPPADADRPAREPRGRLPKLHTAADFDSLLKDLNVHLGSARHKALVETLIERTAKGVTIRDIDAQDQRYPSHGTATAGLLVATPTFTADGEFEPGTLPLFGVDPYSELVPIATSFEPEPIQLILALLYAYVIGADVIHMPRGTENPGRAPRDEPRENFVPTRYGSHAEGWTMFEAVMIAVSRRIPVVCAAGNQGDDRLTYPASLAADDNGIVAVGAVSALGRRSGYASYGDGLTLVAPSNDSAVYNKHQIRLDPNARGALTHRWTIHSRLAGRYVEYSHLAPLSIDVPGARGYRGGVGATVPGNRAADFTLFGGTSAASAIVAGVAALMRRKVPANHKSGGPQWNGVLVRKTLAETASQQIAGRDLRPDRSNHSDETHDDKALAKRLFGAGVVDAKAAIAAMAPPAPPASNT